MLVDTGLQLLAGIVVAEIVGAIVLFRLKMAWYSIGLTILLGLVFLPLVVVVQEMQVIGFLRYKAAPAIFSSSFIIYSLVRLHQAEGEQEEKRAEYRLAVKIFWWMVALVITAFVVLRYL